MTLRGAGIGLAWRLPVGSLPASSSTVPPVAVQEVEPLRAASAAGVPASRAPRARQREKTCGRLAAQVKDGGWSLTELKSSASYMRARYDQPARLCRARCMPEGRAASRATSLDASTVELFAYMLGKKGSTGRKPRRLLQRDHARNHATAGFGDLMMLRARRAPPRAWGGCSTHYSASDPMDGGVRVGIADCVGLTRGSHCGHANLGCLPTAEGLCRLRCTEMVQPAL